MPIHKCSHCHKPFESIHDVSISVNRELAFEGLLCDEHYHEFNEIKKRQFQELIRFSSGGKLFAEI